MEDICKGTAHFTGELGAGSWEGLSTAGSRTAWKFRGRAAVSRDATTTVTGLQAQGSSAVAGARYTARPAYNTRISRTVKPYAPQFGVVGQPVMLASPGPEQSVGMQESGATVAEEGMQHRELIETAVSQHTAPELGTPVLHSVPLDAGSDRASGTRKVQNQGLREAASHFGRRA